jgi:hypothetical protein
LASALAHCKSSLRFRSCAAWEDIIRFAETVYIDCPVRSSYVPEAVGLRKSVGECSFRSWQCNCRNLALLEQFDMAYNMCTLFSVACTAEKSTGKFGVALKAELRRRQLFRSHSSA